jgi:hypothetical protein
MDRGSWPTFRAGRSARNRLVEVQIPQKCDFGHLGAAKNDYLTPQKPAGPLGMTAIGNEVGRQSELNPSEEARDEMANSRSSDPSGGRAERVR